MSVRFVNSSDFRDDDWFEDSDFEKEPELIQACLMEEDDDIRLSINEVGCEEVRGVEVFPTSVFLVDCPEEHDNELDEWIDVEEMEIPVKDDYPGTVIIEYWEEREPDKGAECEESEEEIIEMDEIKNVIKEKADLEEVNEGENVRINCLTDEIEEKPSNDEARVLVSKVVVDKQDKDKLEIEILEEVSQSVGKIRVNVPALRNIKKVADKTFTVLIEFRKDNTIATGYSPECINNILKVGKIYCTRSSQTTDSKIIMKQYKDDTKCPDRSKIVAREAAIKVNIKMRALRDVLEDEEDRIVGCVDERGSAVGNHVLSGCEEENSDKRTREGAQTEQGKILNKSIEMPTIIMRCGNKTLDALVDTGAQIFAITGELYEFFKNKNYPMNEIPLKRTMLRGILYERGIMIKKKVQIKFRILNREMIHEFLVIDNLVHNAVLGIDWVLKYEVKIVCVKRIEVQIPKRETNGIKTLSAHEVRREFEDLKSISSWEDEAIDIKAQLAVVTGLVTQIAKDVKVKMELENSMIGSNDEINDQISRKKKKRKKKIKVIDNILDRTRIDPSVHKVSTDCEDISIF